MGIFYKENGGITVFISLILVPIILFSFIVIDCVRIYGMKAILEDSVKLSANAGLSAYDKAIKDAYGLLVISKNEEELTNNLIKYFDSTIRASDVNLNVEDSYTMSIINNVRETLVQDNNFSFNNLIKMDVENYSISGVDGSQMFYPYTVKRQIVEYMKYRGLVSMGSNFLDKLSVFKELPKQQKVIESKVDYDDELNEINKACESAYKYIVEYEENNAELNGYTYNKFVDYLCEGNADFEGLSTINRVYLGVYDNKSIIGKRSDLKSDVKNCSFQEVVDFFDDYKNFAYLDGLKKEDNIANTEKFITYYLDINSNANDLGEIIEFERILSLKYKEKIDEINGRYDELVKSSGKGDKDKIEKDRKKEIEIIKSQYDKVEDISATCANTANILLNDLFDRKNYTRNLLNKEINKINNFLNSKYKRIDLCVNNLEKAKKNLSSILVDILPRLKEKSNVWKENIDNLSDGNIKEDFKQGYNQVDKLINESQIKVLISKLDKDYEYYKELKIALDNTLFNNYNFIVNQNIKSIDKIYPATNFNINDYEAAVEESVSFFNKNLILNPKVEIIQKLTYKNTAFYRYLERNYQKKNSNSNDVSKDNSKKEKENMMSKVNSAVSEYERASKSNENGTNIIPTSGPVYEDFATTLFKNAMDKEKDSIAKNNSNNIKMDEHFDANNAGEIAKEQVDSMGDSIGVIGAIGQYSEGILENGRDDLLITEYLTEMFSCYTTKENDKSLSNIELNKDNNYIFGKELEYILWGCIGDSTSTNVTYTIASIFGLRFVLNTVYAYTDAEIAAFTLSVATALAGFTGFGIPIVQNVLIIALSLGETSMDIVRLLKGESVEVYKSSATWLLKPSSITRETVEFALKKASEGIINKISETIINVAENYTDENISKLENEFDEFTEVLVENLQVDITNILIAPLETQVSTILGIDALDDISIDDMFDQAYNSIIQDIKNEPDSFGKNIKFFVVEEFISEFLPKIKGEINNIVSNVTNKIEDIEKEINEMIEEIITDVSSTVKSKVFENGYEKLKDEVKQSFRGLTGDINEKINKSIDKFANEMSSGYSIPNGVDGDNKRVGFNIGMTYKEYIKIFIFAGLVSGKENIYISRMNDLIKLNMVCSKNSPSRNFIIKEAYTMINVNAKTRVKTTFARQSIFKDASLGNYFSLQYSTVAGY